MNRKTELVFRTIKDNEQVEYPLDTIDDTLHLSDGDEFHFSIRNMTERSAETQKIKLQQDLHPSIEILNNYMEDVRKFNKEHRILHLRVVSIHKSLDLDYSRVEFPYKVLVETVTVVEV